MLPKRSKVKTKLIQWLKDHLKIQEKLSFSNLLVSSDIIESLFGKFKHVIERSPQADMNRTILLIPALCGKIDEATIIRIFSQTSHADFKNWEKKNIPYTVHKRRQTFFTEIESKKRENFCDVIVPVRQSSINHSLKNVRAKRLNHKNCVCNCSINDRI